ncbi:hypothetical protein PF005_g4722 [Phytophthora fragariae]|uniref:RxLR effector protein n=1 Tax=Phytophthora fragariae TaxID=53985 RepID=A0A6A3YYW4_9STRA|nr:hypothetical protein PF003_g4776 [Phytophthora fragariae]KAE8945309.1 hypothetical protein PF009_g5049 [Phytophthora fragariae]KAE9024195.1 hypothetical protein PF011_g3635 [Phytophthora fragariae]KAE9129830.1 hypothetical protein PF007_g4760 [Phytophthora fragariae]KAE9129909.1 hypothetical protein PF010_g4046 [Phytophthora fragariae]
MNKIRIVCLLNGALCIAFCPVSYSNPHLTNMARCKEQLVLQRKDAPGPFTF